MNRISRQIPNKWEQILSGLSFVPSKTKNVIQKDEVLLSTHGTEKW